MLDATAEGLDAATGGVGLFRLDELRVADLGRARSLLEGWVDLPPVTGEPGPVAVAGALSYDGAARRVVVADPLVIAANGAEIARVSAEATLPELGPGPVKIEAAAPDLAALVTLLAAFDLASPDAPPTGAASVAFEGTLDAADPVTTLAGGGALTLGAVTVEGLEVGGTVPVEAGGGRFVIPADAGPLSANGGTLALGGAALDLSAGTLALPEGEFAGGVGLNPVLVSQIGRYVNPLFFDPEDARGMLDVRLVGASSLSLSEPFKPGGGRVTLEFAIRDLYLDNDVIGAMAQSLTGQAGGSLRRELRAVSGVPGVREQLDGLLGALDLSEEVKREVSSVRGEIARSRVALDDGVADTRITFDLVDPRRKAAERGDAETFPLTFAGRVNLETLAIDLGVTVPPNLLEKWFSEGDDLVELFGERPIRNLAPDGVTIGFGGTTIAPTADGSGSMPRSSRARSGWRCGTRPRGRSAGGSRTGSRGCSTEPAGDKPAASVCRRGGRGLACRSRDRAGPVPPQPPMR